MSRGYSRRRKTANRWKKGAMAAVVLIVFGSAAGFSFCAREIMKHDAGIASESSISPELRFRETAEYDAEGDFVTEGEKLARGDAPTEAILGGAELMMLKSQSKGQMMSFLLETKEGSLIVIDGGRWEDGDYLEQQIRERGGHVSAWLLTHAHTDHVGALLNFLQSGKITEMSTENKEGILVDNFYFNFADVNWYAVHDQQELGTADAILRALNTQPREKLHIVAKGDTITVDEVSFEVMNDRYAPDDAHVGDNDGNDCDIVYRAMVHDVSILFLGDLGRVAGDLLLADAGAEKLRSDIVQMAHHGQNGVGENVYQAVDPEICLWPTPEWLWENADGQFKTDETKEWIRKLDVKRHYVTKDGDQILR